MRARVTFTYALLVVLAVFLTWLLHEFAHWSAAEILGYKSILRINSVSQVEGQNPSDCQAMWISAAGPLVTILQASVAFLFLRNRWHPWAYLLLFVPFYMRLLAGAMNFIKPNDEGRISEFLGLGLFTISILVSLGLFLLVRQIAKKYQLSWKFQAWTTLFVMIVSSALIMIDQFWKLRII